jgi:hypothetical protein
MYRTLVGLLRFFGSGIEEEDILDILIMMCGET